jgi:hypothetical protein
MPPANLGTMPDDRYSGQRYTAEYADPRQPDALSAGANDFFDRLH